MGMISGMTVESMIMRPLRKEKGQGQQGQIRQSGGSSAALIREGSHSPFKSEKTAFRVHRFLVHLAFREDVYLRRSAWASGIRCNHTRKNVRVIYVGRKDKIEVSHTHSPD
jgi:hypothetical protein